MRHAVREYTIHRALQHPNIVELVDVFEIDMNSFATVLQFCNGDDLDAMLKVLSLLLTFATAGELAGRGWNAEKKGKAELLRAHHRVCVFGSTM